MSAEALDSIVSEHLPRACSGDRAAFGRIVAASQNSVTAIALAIVRDVPTSQDIAQDAFINAWNNLPQLRNTSSFLPWLRQITRNLARDHLRRRASEKRYNGDMDDILAVVADPTPDTPDLLSRQHEEQIVAELIDELPEDTREILLIYYREGQSSKQVAALLGMQDAAVRKRLQRARDSLRQDMLKRIGDFARTSAPGIAFTALVIGGLSLTPGAAMAAGAAAGGALAGKKLGLAAGGVGKGFSKLLFGGANAGKGAGKLLLGAAGGALFALLAGIAGVVLGVRRYWITAIDDEEKRSLTRYSAVAIAVVVLFAAGMFFAGMDGDAMAPGVVFIVMMTAVGAMNLLWLPRLLERRHEIERRRDPGRAEIERADERRYAIWSMLAGMLLGVLALGVGMLTAAPPV
ncbi:RNA polymerase sigma factor [Aquimonas sp.]|jgi:RNA polymerase sigma factor (sigma-70 family)|uniref:RNA polymerase sigma factor n=1 Tax=Aquimonas sp. TaxID=1872588 RepID=UPI0037BEFBD0